MKVIVELQYVKLMISFEAISGLKSSTVDLYSAAKSGAALILRRKVQPLARPALLTLRSRLVLQEPSWNSNIRSGANINMFVFKSSRKEANPFI